MNMKGTYRGAACIDGHGVLKVRLEMPDTVQSGFLKIMNIKD